MSTDKWLDDAIRMLGFEAEREGIRFDDYVTSRDLIDAFLDSAANDGWKLTPRIMNHDMVKAASSAPNKPMAWAESWDAAPAPEKEGEG